METNCKNCSIALQPDYDYCPKCSQNAHLHRLSLHELLHEAIHYFTHADKGIFQLVRDLCIKRGQVAREYASGKRKKYFSPLNFFLLVSAVYVFTMSFGDTSTEKVDMFKKYPELTQIKNKQTQQRIVQMYVKRDQGIAMINKHSNLVSMASMPLTALLFWLFYRRGRYNYTEHMVASMYMYGFSTLVFAVVIAVLHYLLKVDINYIFAGFFIFQIIYFSNFYYTFMGEFTRRKAWKAFFVNVFSLVVLFIISGSLMWLFMAGIIG